MSVSSAFNDLGHPLATALLHQALTYKPLARAGGRHSTVRCLFDSHLIMAHQILCFFTLLGAACLALPTENSRTQRQLYNHDFPYAPPLHPQRFVAPPPLQDPLYYPVAGAYNVLPSLKNFQYPPQVQYGVLPAAPISSPIRYAPALVASNGQQQVIFTPPGPHAFLPSNVVVYRPNPKDETGSSEESYVQSFLNFVSHFVSSPQPAVEKPDGAEPPAAEAEKPEKVQAAQAGSSAEKEDKKEEKKGIKKEEKEDEKKENSVVVDRPAPQRFVVVGEPQFFGRFAGIPQTIRQPQVPSINKGAVSSYLLFRNFGPAPGEIEQDNEYPQSAPEFDFDVTQDAPGRAALSYQKFLAQANQKEVDDSASVVVEAASKDANEDNAQQAEASSENSESEKVDAEEETGPTIAQVKPSAIALAGPGGVAAASPIGTALVGPGGMALSSPSATAVAGPAGATPGGIAISPSVNKALKTYNLANKNFASFINQ